MYKSCGPFINVDVLTNGFAKSKSRKIKYENRDDKTELL